MNTSPRYEAQVIAAGKCLGSMNLVGGLALVRRVVAGGGRWDSRSVAFGSGAALFATWMVVSEVALRTNTREP
ncbi:MAG: hypothetical protein ACK5MR_04755 [Cumulibacter sp.]